MLMLDEKRVVVDANETTTIKVSDIVLFEIVLFEIMNYRKSVNVNLMMRLLNS